jgi:hypothetical protein
MEAVEGETRLNGSYEYKFNGFYKLVGPFMGGMLKRENAGRVGNIKRLLESEAHS